MKRSWLPVLPLVATLLVIGAPPSHAAGEVWRVKTVNAAGCQPHTWNLTTVRAGLTAPADAYVAHTIVRSAGKVYMNDGIPFASNGKNVEWSLYPDDSYGPTTGTWPILAGQPMTVILKLERPLGTVVSSWTMIARSCNSKVLLYNGPTSANDDGDALADTADACPTLRSFRSNGCPLRARELTLGAASAPKRVEGRLVSAGHPALSVGRYVSLWKVRPGTDLRVGAVKTDRNGAFSLGVTRGDYYATARGLILPSVGQVLADRSTTVHVP